MRYNVKSPRQKKPSEYIKSGVITKESLNFGYEIYKISKKIDEGESAYESIREKQKLRRFYYHGIPCRIMYNNEIFIGKMSITTAVAIIKGLLPFSIYQRLRRVGVCNRHAELNGKKLDILFDENLDITTDNIEEFFNKYVFEK